MAYIRIKRHYKKKYAYLVESVWNSKKQASEQRVLAYIGVVVNRKKAKLTFIPPYPKNYCPFIKALIKHQCQQFGLSSNAQKRYLQSGIIQKLISFRKKASEQSMQDFATLYHKSGLAKDIPIVIALYGLTPKDKKSKHTDQQKIDHHSP
jgi:hypothetical protein